MKKVIAKVKSKVTRKRTPKVPAPKAPSASVLPIEPQARYRGKVIIEEGTRIVGEHELHTIATEDGQRFDLTKEEYRNEVHVSYPTIN